MHQVCPHFTVCLGIYQRYPDCCWNIHRINKTAAQSDMRGLDGDVKLHAGVGLLYTSSKNLLLLRTRNAKLHMHIKHNAPHNEEDIQWAYIMQRLRDLVSCSCAVCTLYATQ